MPKIDVYNIEGKKVSDIELADSVFGIEPNEKIVHSVLVNYMANQRQGTSNTKYHVATFATDCSANMAFYGAVTGRTARTTSISRNNACCLAVCNARMALCHNKAKGNIKVRKYRASIFVAPLFLFIFEATTI